MKFDIAEYLNWQIQRLMQIIGWQGMVAIILFILSSALHFQGVIPLSQKLIEIRRDANKLHSKVALHKSTVSKTINPTHQLDEFYAFFPDGNAMADTLSSLQDAAAQENLILERGEYHLAPESIGQLVRYNIVLPVKGPYPHLRRFIARALRENPSLALDGVSFNRQATITIGVEAQIRMTLYFKEAE